MSKPQDQKLLSPTIQEIVFEEEKLLHFIKGPVDDSLVVVTQSEISIIRIKFYGSDISVEEACKAIKLPKLLDKVSSFKHRISLGWDSVHGMQL